MDSGKEGQERSWAEQHGGAVFGVGVFVALGLLIVLIRIL